MKNPKISVIIPLYNKEKSIERSINSILKQTFRDFEIVVVDDGSTDNSLAVVNAIKDDRILIVSQRNAGPGAARNTGVKNATANWIVFLDADDEILIDTLEFFNTMIAKYPNMDILDSNKYCRRGETLIPMYHPIEGWVRNNMRECYFGRISPGAGFSVFRKTLLERNPYDEHIRRFEDAELLLRLLKGAKVYSSSRITSIHDFNYAEASSRRKDIYEDYAAYLDFNRGGFWQKMCVYRTFLEVRSEYPIEMRRLYPKYYYRYDLLLLHKILNKLKRYVK